LAARKRRIERRLDKTNLGTECPVISASNIHYELADRTQAISAGGIGMIHQVVKSPELDDAINRRLNLFKIYLPYSESDHVLNIAYNLLAGGTCLEHLELLRNDEVYLNALGAQHIPDPTTAGDFCRRFDPLHVFGLMEVFNDTRIKVWQQQPYSFFEEAVTDAVLKPRSGCLGTAATPNPRKLNTMKHRKPEMTTSAAGRGARVLRRRPGEKSVKTGSNLRLFWA
jgi:hypothetical protein